MRFNQSAFLSICFSSSKFRLISNSIRSIPMNAYLPWPNQKGGSCSQLNICLPSKFWILHIFFATFCYSHLLPIITILVHGPEQISVPSGGWAKFGDVFHAHICSVHYSSYDKPLHLAAFMWLSPILIILFSKNYMFLFFNDFKELLNPSSMSVLIEWTKL